MAHRTIVRSFVSAESGSSLPPSRPWLPNSEEAKPLTLAPRPPCCSSNPSLQSHPPLLRAVAPLCARMDELRSLTASFGTAGPFASRALPPSSAGQDGAHPSGPCSGAPASWNLSSAPVLDPPWRPLIGPPPHSHWEVLCLQWCQPGPPCSVREHCAANGAELTPVASSSPGPGFVCLVFLNRGRWLQAQPLGLKVRPRASRLISLGLSFRRLNRDNNSTHLLSYCEGSPAEAVTGESGSPLVVALL